MEQPLSGRAERSSGARTVARKLALQALYRWQLNNCPWQDLVQEFAEDPDMARADADYFRELIVAVCDQSVALDAALAPLLDRKPAELDPIEHAVLLIGSHELQHRADIPYRVVINEAVGLARRFGATDGYKYINGVLDRAARLWRAQEH
jgi:transcription antitermination protein NusB